MASYELLIKRSAAREIEAIPRRQDRRRVIERIRRLADEPRPLGCQKLSGRDRYRVRQGDDRILYSIEDARLVVYVVKIGHRKDVYKQS